MYQDALRDSILSLASFDIGFRIHYSLSERVDNSMYHTSWEQRNAALARLDLCTKLVAKPHEEDLILGATLALSFRDVSLWHRGFRHKR